MPKKTGPSSRPEPAHFVEPMQCLAVDRLPEGLAWQYEIKFDGYRALGIKGTGRVSLLSRRANDLSRRFAAIATALANLPDETVVDGEVVALDESGRPSFNVLQNNLRSHSPLEFYVFDLLHLAGRSLIKLPLTERRQMLRQQVMPFVPQSVRYSESFKSSATEMIAAVKRQDLEGVIAKRRDSLYESSRRSGAWVKLRVNKGQELVIGGFVPGFGSFDSIIVGYYNGPNLIYVARVRNGFTPGLRERIFNQFRGRETKKCPFANLPQDRRHRWGEGLTADKMAECLWLRPEIVAQIEYAEWTEGDHLRHSKFIALRDDKDPISIVRE